MICSTKMQFNKLIKGQHSELILPKMLIPEQVLMTQRNKWQELSQEVIPFPCLEIKTPKYFTTIFKEKK